MACECLEPYRVAQRTKPHREKCMTQPPTHHVPAGSAKVCTVCPSFKRRKQRHIKLSDRVTYRDLRDLTSSHCRRRSASLFLFDSLRHKPERRFFLCLARSATEKAAPCPRSSKGTRAPRNARLGEQLPIYTHFLRHLTRPFRSIYATILFLRWKLSFFNCLSQLRLA